MRKRSCRFPVWMTVIALSFPAFYVVLVRLNKPKIFSWDELAGKILIAAIWSIIIWFFYGVFCFVAKPLPSEPAGKEQHPDPAIADVLSTHDFVRGQCKKCRSTKYYIKANQYRCPK